MKMEQGTVTSGRSSRWQREPARKPPTRGIWPPSEAPNGLPEEADVEREIRQIVHVLREMGPLGRATLRMHLEAILWGPGRFSRALDLASRRGLITRVGGRNYALAARRTG
jgi:hypothetical protein